MGVEYERKYTATHESLDSIELLLFKRHKTRRMQTTYYDTPTNQLSARRIMLRQRMENDICICTVKIPLPDGSRGEWECRSKDLKRGIKRLCQLGAPEELLTLTEEGLQEVCGARFDRLAITVTLPECTVELALDQGVLIGGGQEVPLCELEVELKSGSREAATMYAAQLALAYGLVPESQSKFRRASLLAGGN